MRKNKRIQKTMSKTKYVDDASHINEDNLRQNLKIRNDDIWITKLSQNHEGSR